MNITENELKHAKFEIERQKTKDPTTLQSNTCGCQQVKSPQDLGLASESDQNQIGHN